jgi:hypothetical protein
MYVYIYLWNTIFLFSKIQFNAHARFEQNLKHKYLYFNQELIDKASLSSHFGFNDRMVSFSPKKGKLVMLLPTMHVDKATNEQMKFEIIHF